MPQLSDGIIVFKSSKLTINVNPTGPGLPHFPAEILVSRILWCVKTWEDFQKGFAPWQNEQ